ncbi:DUF2399 domain-containing protein [Streptomyces umbrinus]
MCREPLLCRLPPTGARDVNDGGRLPYHRGFDWSGIDMTVQFIAHYGAEPWRMGADDHLEGLRTEEDHVAWPARSAALHGTRVWALPCRSISGRSTRKAALTLSWRSGGEPPAGSGTPRTLRTRHLAVST